MDLAKIYQPSLYRRQGADRATHEAIIEADMAALVADPDAAEAPEAADPDATTPVTPAEPAALVAVALRHELDEPAWMVNGDEY